MKITEHDGTETLLFEGSDNIANTMINFFSSELGLITDMTDKGQWDWTNKQVRSEDNRNRGTYYRNEYIKFCKQPLQLI